MSSVSVPTDLRISPAAFDDTSNSKIVTLSPSSRVSERELFIAFTPTIRTLASDRVFYFFTRTFMELGQIKELNDILVT